MYQGDANDINLNSSTARLVDSANDETVLTVGYKEAAMMAGEEQAHPAIGAHFLTPQGKGQSSHLPLEDSSSRLTDMLNSVSPYKRPFQEKFLPNCPSAVPSPLHNANASLVQTPVRPTPVPFRQMWQPRTPNTVEEHFYMTNEHLDVVGKTTWDLLEISKQQHLQLLNSRQDQLSRLIEKQFEDIKSQMANLHGKADSTAKIHDNILGSLDKLFSSITQDITNVLATHEKKALEMETHVTELQKTVQALQQWLEQKFADMKPGFPAPSFSNPSVPLPMHRPPPGLAGYYGSGAEYGQENQSPMSHVQDSRSGAPVHDNHHEQRVGHGNGYGQQWGARHGYASRMGKEDRSPYSGSSPYHFGGQFSNGYVPGYSSYGYAAEVSEQQHTYNQGPAK